MQSGGGKDGVAPRPVEARRPRVPRAPINRAPRRAHPPTYANRYQFRETADGRGERILISSRIVEPRAPQYPGPNALVARPATLRLPEGRRPFHPRCPGCTQALARRVHPASSSRRQWHLDVVVGIIVCAVVGGIFGLVARAQNV